MEHLLALREISGLSQFAVARKSDVSRMRLSLAETGQLVLTDEEEARIRSVLLVAIEARSLRLRTVLADHRAGSESDQ